MEYKHRQIMQEYGITKNDLPIPAKKIITDFDLRSRMSTKEDKIQELKLHSEEIADAIIEWYEGGGKEEIEQRNARIQNQEPKVSFGRPPKVEDKPVVTNVVVEENEGQNNPTPTPNIPPIEPPKVEEQSRGWGIGNW